jgi:REP element-mobilizing transposase RayT
MLLNNAGKAAQLCLLDIPDHFPTAALGASVIMPNHIHMILKIVGANNYSPLPVRDDGLPVRAKGTSRTLGSIVRGYKIGVTKRVNELRGTPGMKLWQRNYYEHIVRNEDDYVRIAEYIENNPLKWELDDYCLR